MSLSQVRASDLKLQGWHSPWIQAFRWSRLTSHWSDDFFEAQMGEVSRSMLHSQREAEIGEGASSYLLYKLSPLFWVAYVLDSQARLV